jgi:hypothetical protein
VRNNPALGSCLINMVDPVGSACRTVVCAGVLFRPRGTPGSGLQWLLSLGEPNLAFTLAGSSLGEATGQGGVGLSCRLCFCLHCLDCKKRPQGLWQSPTRGPVMQEQGIEALYGLAWHWVMGHTHECHSRSQFTSPSNPSSLQERLGSI